MKKRRRNLVLIISVFIFAIVLIVVFAASGSRSTGNAILDGGIWSKMFDTGAEKVVVNAASVMYNVRSDDLWDNGFNNSDTPSQSAFSRLVFNTNASSVTVFWHTTLTSDYTQWAHIGVRIDNQDRAPINITSSQPYVLDLGSAGTSKNVELTVGLQSNPGQAWNTPIGTFIDNVSYDGAYSFNVKAPVRGSPILVYAESIGVGANADNPESQGYITLLRRAPYNLRTAVDGWGWRSLHEEGSTQSGREALVTQFAKYQPSIIFIPVGANDYGLSGGLWSAVEFGRAYANLTDQIHARLPNVKIVCFTPSMRIYPAAYGNNNYGSGNALGDYAQQVKNICTSSRPWTTLVDADSIITSIDLAGDGVHPTTAGHAKAANLLYPILVSLLTPQNGSCGSSLGICNSGTPSAIDANTTSYIWNCIAMGGGTKNASCSVIISGECGSSARNYNLGETFSSSGLCSVGNANPASVTLGAANGSSASWACMAGTSASCSALRVNMSNVNSLVAYWKLDGDGSDSSGNNHPVTLQNNAGYVSGKSGNALSLNGVNQYASISGNLYSPTNGTLSLWIKKNGEGSDPSSDVIIGSFSSGNGRAPTLGLPSSGKLLWEFGSLSNMVSSATISTGQWAHIALTYDSNYNVKVYVNGVLDSTASSANPGAFNSQMRIGSYIGWSGWESSYFNGLIDDVQIYNRTLSGAEIVAINNSYGATLPVVKYHPADSDSNLQIDPAEYSLYYKAYHLSEPWPTGPSPPSSDQVYYTRALYLYKMGQFYSYNASESSCPICWIRA